jgi:putative nucleotidyltransferase with HDIG domain
MKPVPPTGLHENSPLIRIIFVDDEVNVLYAMRRNLHGMRDAWDMEFVSSGELALESLAKKPADVIVTDMRMPGMDGWLLLAEVKRLYPQTVRLVLSGYAEAGAIMRLVGSAHQYLAKPGDSAPLKAAIAQTQLMRALLSNEDLGLLVGEVSLLPAFPRSIEEISECLRRPNSSVTDAARIISRDVAMTADIMKLVNSAFFGARRQVTSIDRAVAYLGLDTLTALVLAHGLFHGPGLRSMEGLWQHSLDTAMAARAIALVEGLPQTQAEEAFLAGMLHDVGRVVFASRSNVAAIDADVERYHGEVGAYLLGLWGFPSHIVASVALHHSPSLRASRGFELTALVHVADRLAHCNAAGPVTPKEAGIESGLLEELGLLDRWPRWLSAVAGRASDRRAS